MRPIAPASLDDVLRNDRECTRALALLGRVPVEDGGTHDDGPGRAPELHPARLVGGTFVAFLVIAGAAAAVGYWLRAPLVAAGLWFVQTLGGPGIAIGFFLPDAFALPIPNDAILGLGRAGSMPTGPLLGWAFAGGMVGGCVAWRLGRWAGGTGTVRRFMAGRGAGLDRAMRRHGVAVVVVAALTPLPDSVAAWAAGSTGLGFRPYVLASALRIVRIGVALQLIDLGLMSVT
jgi:membrane protein YqaA with SNARE-associated domain